MRCWLVHAPRLQRHPPGDILFFKLQDIGLKALPGFGIGGGLPHLTGLLKQIDVSVLGDPGNVLGRWPAEARVFHGI